MVDGVMARSKRVEFNRAALSEVRLGLADGMFELAKGIVENANPPDATPFGVGLVQGGGAVVWVDGKKVDGTTIGGKQIKKPRALKTGPGIVAIAGFGFPGRFLETGTIDTPAQPFLTPAAASTIPGAEQYLRPAMAKRIGGRA